MASLVWKEYNGSGPTATTITHLKHKTKDEYVNDSNYSIPIPGAGSNHGYFKTTALYSVTCSETLSNFKVYGAGVPSGWTDVILYIGDEVTDTYQQATGTENETGDELVVTHGQVTSKTNFFSTYTSGNKKSVALIGGAASMTGNDQRFSKYIYWQLTVGTGASNGLLTSGSIIGVYDLA